VSSGIHWAGIVLAVFLMVLLVVVPALIVLRDLRAGRPDPAFEEVPRRR
jgi:hypothetical protein